MLAFVLLAVLVIPCCLAEDVYHLPVDFSAGPKANPDCYTSKETYEDESLSVRMETRDIDGCAIPSPGSR